MTTKNVITEIDPEDPPYFMQSWMSNQKPNPSTDIEKDIALRPLSRFFNLYKSKQADPTVDSLIEKTEKELKGKNSFYQRYRKNIMQMVMLIAVLMQCLK